MYKQFVVYKKHKETGLITYFTNEKLPGAFMGERVWAEDKEKAAILSLQEKDGLMKFYGQEVVIEGKVIEPPDEYHFEKLFEDLPKYKCKLCDKEYEVPPYHLDQYNNDPEFKLQFDYYVCEWCERRIMLDHQEVITEKESIKRIEMQLIKTKPRLIAKLLHDYEKQIQEEFGGDYTEFSYAEEVIKLLKDEKV